MPSLRPLLPWLLALLALAWAGASHVPWDRLIALAPILVLALILALALLVAVRLVRRRRRAPAPDPALQHAAQRRRALQRTIGAARRLRPAHVWLCLGLPRHGKTTLLAAAGPQRELSATVHDLPALDHPARAPGLDPPASARPGDPIFRLLEPSRALTIEHPHDFAPLRALRPRQPLDAIVLVLGLPELLTTDLPALAAPLRAQLTAALAGLAVDPPIFLVCTKLDRLAGHRELATDHPWGFDLADLTDLPQQLSRWSQWVHAQRLARIAVEPDPHRRARLFTFGARFERACERLAALADDLFAPHAGAPLRLRGVHFTAARIDPVPPTDDVLAGLAAALHLDLRPDLAPSHPVPGDAIPVEAAHASHHPADAGAAPRGALHPPLAADLGDLLAALRRRAPEAARDRPHRRRSARRIHLLAAALATAALALSISALDAAAALQRHLQALAGLGAELGAPEPVPPLLALRAELDPTPDLAPTARLAPLLAPDLRPDLRAAYRRAARERLLRPLWTTLERELQRSLTAAAPAAAPIDLLRAYLLLTAPAPSNMSDAPGPEDPVQRDWLLAELPTLADPGAAGERRLLLATLFAAAAPDELRFPRDHALVERVRAQLRARGDDDAVLQAALAAVDGRCDPLALPAISHAEHLSGGPALACSFTRDGWPRVQEQLLRATDSDSDWVLGRSARADAGRLDRLRGRYDALYIAAWTDFLQNLRLRRPADLAGASRLLTELTGEDRPLTRVFQALDHHTRGLQHLRPDERSLLQLLGGLDHPERSAGLARAFAPLLGFAIAGPDRQAGLDRYHARLAELLGALEAARRDPAELPDLQTLLDAALADTHALLQPPELRRFRPLLSSLLLPPLTALQAALRDQDKLALGAAYCAEIYAPLRRLTARYPFTRDARDELPLAEFTAFFHPESGALRRFRDARLAPLLVVHGLDFTARPAARGDDHPLAPAVLALLHRAAALGELAFAGPDPGLDLEVDLHCNADIGRVTFTLDGASHTYTCGPDHRARMRWPGPDDPRGATLELLGRDGRRETVPGPGPWGLWRLLEKDGLVLAPDDPASPRLVFHLDLRPSRLGTLDLALTPTRTRGATLFYGDPARAPGPPVLLAPLRAHELLDPPAALFVGLPGCDELPDPGE